MAVGGLVRVVGESHYQEALTRVAGGKRTDSARLECIAELRPQPDNPYDPAAVAVFIRGEHVGHLSREEARSFRPLVDRAITRSGTATAQAQITGGWRRDNGDEGSFGVNLFFDPRPSGVAPPSGDEFRLRGATTVSVSNEEHYQQELLEIVGDASLTAGSYPVLVELAFCGANPHTKSDTSVLAAVINGAVVGYLTPAMTDRLARVMSLAAGQSQRVTCSGQIFRSDKAGGTILELRLSACPHGRDETHVTDPYFQTNVDRITTKRATAIHLIAASLPDGGYRTACGRTISASEAVFFASTKPFLGVVHPETKELQPDGRLCQSC